VRAHYPFPLELGLSDGNVWVSSVEDGFVEGAVTRIPFDGGRSSQALVLPTRPVYSLAVGSGTTWALVGPWSSLRLAAIDQSTGHTTVHPIDDVGWIAADDTGATPGLFGVTGSGRAIAIAGDGSTAWTAATGRIESRPAVGLGSVWVASRSTLYRLDPGRGSVEAKIPLANAATELAIGGGRVWAATLHETHGAGSYRLVEIDPRPGRIVATAAIDGPVGSIAYGSGALWLGRDTTSVSLLRIDPRTLRQRLFATRLDLAAS
jgi:hypothetical protein